MVKKGDTLIEVTLAVGIFSLVAISVVAVMAGGMSSTQTALETTLAREEIDAQAEALRFIHSAYIADDESGDKNDPYTKLWEEITKKAVNVKGMSKQNAEKFQQYRPSTCNDIYNSANGKDVLNRSFVINTRALSNLTTTNYKNAYFSYAGNDSKFIEAKTYPRIVYSSAQANNTDALTNNSGTNIYRVEGVYVLAISDPASTYITGSSNRGSAYYDFYIRTCWYGTGSENPSTISTVIRLYNPRGIIK